MLPLLNHFEQLSLPLVTAGATIQTLPFFLLSAVLLTYAKDLNRSRPSQQLSVVVQTFFIPYLSPLANSTRNDKAGPFKLIIIAS